VDDETLPAGPGQFRTVIVPAAYVLSQETAERLARFARGGGTVILAGASGVVDPWLNKYANVGGAAWAELGWIAGSFRAEPADVDFLPGKTLPPRTAKSKPFRGVNFGTMPGAEPLRDGRGNVVGWTRPWGKGKLVAYGLLPDAGLYSANPHPLPQQAAWIRQLITAGGLRPSGHWASSQTIENRSDQHGEGEPVVEVVVRIRQGRESQEKFVFVLNRGGAGSGLVEVPLAGGDWQASDALSGAPLAGALADGVWRLDLAMKPWEYRVFHLSRRGGRL